MTLKNLIAAAIMYTALATGCATKPKDAPKLDIDPMPKLIMVENTKKTKEKAAQDDPTKKEKSGIEITAGYNALENAVTSEGNVRTRLLTNIGIGKFKYHALNEMENLDPDTYFGIHRPAYGFIEGIELEAKIKTNSKGIVDAKFGIRDTHIPKLLKGYGFVEIIANNNELDFTIFYGKSLGKGFSVEALQSVIIPFEGSKDVGFYNELQLNYKLSDKFSIFGRGELSDFEFDQGTVLLGVTLKLGK